MEDLQLELKEVTKENKEKYLDQIAKMEVEVLEYMQSQGKIGQLFITGKEDIEEYVNSKENTVMVAVDGSDNVVSATYITKGQIPYTYNDLTKYYKQGNGYKDYVKSLYEDESLYKKDMLKAYQLKIDAFDYATKKLNIKDIKYTIAKEIDDNEFHEKSEVRDNLNKYMYEYVKTLDKQNNSNDYSKLYDKFYWTNIEDIENEFGKNIENLDEKVSDYEMFLQNSKLKIFEEPNFNIEPYYSSNTSNTVEIDTYITYPNNRSRGVARQLVYEGVKKNMEQYFEDEQNSEIFLCSTLHRENYSSKYVSEFFGLKDNLYVKRRQGRNRQVHFTKIEKENYKQYLQSMEEKLNVLYGYKHGQINVSNDRKKQIYKEQIEYEKDQISGLLGAKTGNNKRYTLDSEQTKGKVSKIKFYQEKIKQIEKEEKEQNQQEQKDSEWEDR